MGKTYGQWRALALFLVFLQPVSAIAHGGDDWLDRYARAVPWTNWFRPTHDGGWTRSSTLAKRKVADVADYFISRADLLGRTPAGNKALFEQYMEQPLRMKHAIFNHADFNGHGYPILDYLAVEHFKRSPKGFVELLWSFKYSESKRPAGATANNLLKALAPADRQAAIDQLRKSAKPTDSVERGVAYTFDAPNWKRTAKDKTNISYSLRDKAFKGGFGIDYVNLARLSSDARINDLDVKVSREYDANHSGILSNIGSDKLGEIGNMEARGNYGRNDATHALSKFLFAEIAHGSPEQAVGIFLTLHPFTKSAMLRSVEHEYYIAPLALLLDVMLEENQNPENPHNLAVDPGRVGNIVTGWILDRRDPRFVARMLPLMKHRAVLLREIKAQNVDMKSENSPFTYLEPLATEFGKLYYGPNFKLIDETPLDYADLLQRWTDGKIER